MEYDLITQSEYEDFRMYRKEEHEKIKKHKVKDKEGIARKKEDTWSLNKCLVKAMLEL